MCVAPVLVGVFHFIVQTIRAENNKRKHENWLNFNGIGPNAHVHPATETENFLWKLASICCEILCDCVW